jgi:hypothetical protein
MPIDTVLSMNLQALYCGVPINCSLAYKQLVTDASLPVPPGQHLVERWMNEVNGAWRTIRDAISTAFEWQCAVVTYDSTAEVVILSSLIGIGVGASWPTQMCLQVNTPSDDPYPDKREGRFYMPGFLSEHILNCNIDPDFLTQLDSWMLALMTIDTGSFVLYPHGKYLDRLGGNDSIASEPYYHPFIKVIGQRNVDECATFAASGAAEYAPVVGDP